MSVETILQALAENAGQAQLRKGAIYGNLVTGVSQLPEQIAQDRERAHALALHTAQVQQQMDLEKARAGREDQLARHQDVADAQALRRQAIVNAGFTAGIASHGNPTGPLDTVAAYKVVSDMGDPSAISDVIAKHKGLVSAPIKGAPGDEFFDPDTRKPIPDMSVPEKQTPEARQMFLISKQKTGVPLTKAEQADVDAYTEVKAPKTRTAEDQALDAYAKSIGKTKAEDLSYADRQNFDKNKEAITASSKFQQHVNERNYDNAHPAPVKATDQNKLEQEYRGVLTRAMSSRSGGIGAEDAKVQQANHLTALIDASYDPKTDTYNIPRVQQAEMAMGLAKLVAPGGTVGVQMEQEINQRTAKGDLAGALTYLTGKPFNGTTQDLVKMYRDSILRQGEVAQTNREGEMAYLRGLAPTDLEEPRRQALEKTSLNPLRQSRVIQNTKTGERKLQVSTDGGATWK